MAKTPEFDAAIPLGQTAVNRVLSDEAPWCNAKQTIKTKTEKNFLGGNC
jgi:hypothetical protein